ncbi:hypothetical protein PFISCL1PPCAC_21346, partial [Pristionchus fissidentatus]
QYLATHSPVFRSMFYGDYGENNKDVIELRGVKYEIPCCARFCEWPICFRSSRFVIRPRP